MTVTEIKTKLEKLRTKSEESDNDLKALESAVVKLVDGVMPVKDSDKLIDLSNLDKMLHDVVNTINAKKPKGVTEVNGMLVRPLLKKALINKRKTIKIVDDIEEIELVKE